MVDSDKLRGIIAERGMSQRQVAGQIGMTEKTFYAKMQRRVFGTDEVEAMIDLLRIEHPMEIFFAKQ